MAFRLTGPGAWRKLQIWKSLDVNDISSSATITSGSGAPSGSEPNGSIYLRTDGVGGTTLYLRVLGAWEAVEGSSDFGSGGILTDLISESTAGAGVSIAMPDNDSIGFTLKEGANNYFVAITSNGTEKLQFLKTMDIDAAIVDIATQATNLAIKDNESAALNIAEGANSYIKCVTSNGTESVDIAKNLNALAGLDVSGAAFTVDNVAITQTTGGQVTLAGNVDANAGLDVAGGSLTVASGQVLTTNTISETTAAAGVTIDSLKIKDGEIVSNRYVQVVINATGGVGGATGGGLDVDVQNLEGINVSVAKAILILVSAASGNTRAGLISTVTFSAASAGSIIASGNGYCYALTDATGNFTCVISDSADETVYISAVSSDAGVASAGQGCVVVESVVDAATWSA